MRNETKKKVSSLKRILLRSDKKMQGLKERYYIYSESRRLYQEHPEPPAPPPPQKKYKVKKEREISGKSWTKK